LEPEPKKLLSGLLCSLATKRRAKINPKKLLNIYIIPADEFPVESFDVSRYGKKRAFIIFAKISQVKMQIINDTIRRHSSRLPFAGLINL